MSFRISDTRRPLWSDGGLSSRSGNSSLLLQPPRQDLKHSIPYLQKEYNMKSKDRVAARHQKLYREAMATKQTHLAMIMALVAEARQQYRKATAEYHQIYFYLKQLQQSGVEQQQHQTVEEDKFIASYNSDGDQSTADKGGDDRNINNSRDTNDQQQQQQKMNKTEPPFKPSTKLTTAEVKTPTILDPRYHEHGVWNNIMRGIIDNCFLANTRKVKDSKTGTVRDISVVPYRDALNFLKAFRLFSPIDEKINLIIPTTQEE